MTKKTRAADDSLGALHEGIAKHLLARVASGEATAQELQAAIKFLKDNGITALGEPDSPVDQLSKALPTFDDDPMDADEAPTIQ